MSGKRMKKQVDMLHGPLAGKLILFALPLALSSILQQLFNSADVAVVGRFAGSEALAAVGANVANVGVFINLLVGASVGPNVVIANLIGQRKEDQVSEVVHTVIAFSTVCGIGLMAVGLLLSHPLLVLTGTPTEVLHMAEIYLRVYLLGIPFIMLYNFGSAILRSIGDTERPLFSMILSGIVNVVLNLVFVIIFHLSVLGVALATVLSNVLSAGMILWILCHEGGMIHLSLHRLFSSEATDSTASHMIWHTRRKYLRKILRVGLPAGIQGMVFSVSNIFIQAGINEFGAMAIAGSSAALNFEYFTYDIASAFAQATVTFSSQNYGAGQFDRCRRIFWLTLLEGMLFVGALSAVFGVRPAFWASLYSGDPAVIEFAVSRMMHVMILEALCTTYEVGASGLRSYGYSILPALLSILGTVVFRIIWMYTVFRRFHTFGMLMTVYPVSWIFTGGTILLSYFILTGKTRTGNNV